MKRSVLIMTGYCPGSYSPAGERVRHLALASSSVFRKVIVLTSRGTEKQPKQGTSSEFFFYSINFTKGMPFPISAIFDPIKFLMFTVYGYLLSKRYRPSHVMASMPSLEIGVSAWFLAKLLGMKLIVDLRDDWESSVESQLTRYIPIELIRPLFKIANKMYSFSTSILVVTETIGDAIRMRGVNTYIVFAPNGADTSVFLPQGDEIRSQIRLKFVLPQDKVAMVYCGSGVNPYYRLDLLLFSVRSLPDEVKEKSFFVFYVYNGIEHLKVLKAKLGISDSVVEIRDPLPRAVLAEVLAACDVGLVPFDDEPYLLCARSSKLYEYLSAGLYVISSGPEGGELDRFFSARHDLGLFTLPRVRDFVHVFSRVVERMDGLFGDDYRCLRYSFIKENYDRQKTMKETMKAIAEVSSNRKGDIC